MFMDDGTLVRYWLGRRATSWCSILTRASNSSLESCQIIRRVCRTGREAPSRLLACVVRRVRFQFRCFGNFVNNLDNLLESFLCLLKFPLCPEKSQILLSREQCCGVRR